MSASEQNQKHNDQAALSAPTPKRITNAQTVCNEKNEKGKLCNGHLKQLRTAGEAAEIHLRGDDVLFKCQTCGTFYMGPPLGHVRDPNKQTRFVEAELTALLQAAGGTLPVVKKDARGVFVLETPGEHAAPKPAAAKPAAPKPAGPPETSAAPVSSAPKPAPPAATPVASTPASPIAHKAGAQPNRELFRRSTYAGVKDSGPVPGETFEQKVARLKAVAAAVKQRADEGGGDAAPSQTSPMPAAVAPAIAAIEDAAPLEAGALAAAVEPTAPEPPAHKATGQADRTLMRRSTYCGVVDTGPVPGETFEQKIERLRKVSAAVKQRSDEAGG